MTSQDSARDIDSIRRALGPNQLTLHGFSNVAYVAQTYSTLFPTRVRRMVLDGTTDPTKIWYQSNLAQDVGIDRNMNRWFGWLAGYDHLFLTWAPRRRQSPGGVTGPRHSSTRRRRLDWSAVTTGTRCSETRLTARRSGCHAAKCLPAG